MSQEKFNVGDMVILSAEGWQGTSGIVSHPATEGSNGHALVLLEGHIHGIDVSINDVQLADESSEGFAQLAYNLIKLGSHVIENTLLSS